MGDSAWDVIHFNFGLWDWYGWSQDVKTRPESYAASLDSIVTKMKKTNARLIFGMTTPPCIGPEGKVKFVVTEERAKAFNDAARAVMKKHGVQINDLYAVIGEDRAKYQRGENNVHYTDEGRDLLASAVARVIGEALPKTPPPVFAQEVQPVHMANGIKIGEVDSTSAIIWTRLTKNAERNIDGKPFPKKGKSARFEDLDAMEGSVPGTPGEVRLTYWPVDQKSVKTSTDWQAVDVNRDFTHPFQITDLLPGARYTLLAEGRPKEGEAVSCKVDGAFSTAPPVDTSAGVRFAVVSCQEYPRRDTPDGHKIYPVMQKQKLDFFVHTGDIEYYDKPGPYADTLELARFKWNRIYSLPYLRSFHNQTASFFMKDDHDTLKNDCWPGQTSGELTWDQGLSTFREQVPMGRKTYRTFRWGKDLQVWLVEGRDFRSPNTMPDGPTKTIWGKEQKQWFFDTVKKSDATFRILISPTPMVGPDRGGKNDNHANRGFTHEGDELRAFIGKQKNMFVICGDRHWQYVAEDPKTGTREYSCGSTSDTHAGGFKESNRSPIHQYLKVKGGFLSVVIERDQDHARAILTHYGVDGTVYNKDVLKAQ